MEQKPRMVIVSYYFPPINNIAARRWAEMIEEIEKTYEVYVITQHTTGDLPVPLDEKRVFRFGTFESFLEHNMEQKAGLIHKVVRKVLTGQLRMIDSTVKNWYFKYRHEMMSLVQQLKPQVLVTTYGPAAASYIGNFIKKQYPGIYWVCDFRDPASLLPMEGKNFFSKKIDNFIDRRIHSKADKFFAVSKTLSQCFSEFYKRDVKVLFNGFNEKEKVNQIKANDASLLAYYAGYIYSHQLESFLIASSAFKSLNIKFNIRLLAQPSEWKNIEGIINRQGLTNVNLLPAVDSKKIHEEEQHADILVVFEDLNKNNPTSKGTLTGKLFEYFKFPIPILAICREDSEIGEILKSTNRGVVVTSKNEIIELLPTLQNLAFNLLETNEYSRQSQAARFIKEITNKY